MRLDRERAAGGAVAGRERGEARWIRGEGCGPGGSLIDHRLEMEPTTNPGGRGASIFQRTPPLAVLVLIKVFRASGIHPLSMSSDHDSSCETPGEHVSALFVQFSSEIRGFILALLPDMIRADDVFQETFLTVTRKAADF